MIFIIPAATKVPLSSVLSNLKFRRANGFHDSITANFLILVNLTYFKALKSILSVFIFLKDFKSLPKKSGS